MSTGDNSFVDMLFWEACKGHFVVWSSTKRTGLEIKICVDKVENECVLSEKWKMWIIEPWGTLKCRKWTRNNQGWRLWGNRQRHRRRAQKSNSEVCSLSHLRNWVLIHLQALAISQTVIDSGPEWERLNSSKNYKEIWPLPPPTLLSVSPSLHIPLAASSGFYPNGPIPRDCGSQNWQWLYGSVNWIPTSLMWKVRKLSLRAGQMFNQLIF